MNGRDCEHEWDMDSVARCPVCNPELEKSQKYVLALFEWRPGDDSKGVPAVKDVLLDFTPSELETLWEELDMTINMMKRRREASEKNE